MKGCTLGGLDPPPRAAGGLRWQGLPRPRFVGIPETSAYLKPSGEIFRHSRVGHNHYAPSSAPPGSHEATELWSPCRSAQLHSQDLSSSRGLALAEEGLAALKARRSRPGARFPFRRGHRRRERVLWGTAMLLKHTASFPLASQCQHNALCLRLPGKGTLAVAVPVGTLLWPGLLCCLGQLSACLVSTSSARPDSAHHGSGLPGCLCHRP